MNKSLKIDKNGNFITANNQWVFCNTLSEYVSQKLQIRLKKFMGEYFLDATDDGIPYFTAFEKNFNINILDSKIKTEILDESNIVGIKSFSSNYNNATREYTINFVAQLSDTTSLVFSSLEAIGGLPT